MNNKSLKEVNDRSDVLIRLGLIENFDKFEDKYTQELDFIELTPSWLKSDFNISKIKLKRNILKNIKASTIEWEYIHEKDSKYNNVALHKIKLLIDDGVETIEFDSRLGGRKSTILEDDLVNKILASNEIEIRIEGALGTPESTVFDYDKKVSSEFKKKLKKFKEAIQDLDEWELYQKAKELIPEVPVQKNEKSIIWAILKWFFIFVVIMAILDAYVGDDKPAKSTKSNVGEVVATLNVS